MNTAEMSKSAALEPFRVDIFRSIWVAALCMNTGLFIQDIASSWLMTSLSQEPIMVALMQTAAMLPYFLLGLPAGALADLIDRRKLLLCGQFWMIGSAAALSVLTITGHTTSWLLLAFTFLLWLGCAAMAPAWSTVAPELVPRRNLEAAIGLNSGGYNLARGFGAAIGGAIVSTWGPGWAFAVHAVCYTVMIRALLRWKYRPAHDNSSERVVSAMRAGVRYVRHSRALRAVLVRTVFFAGSVSVMWSLLPLLARQQLHVNSLQYGLIVSSFGLGTMAGAMLLPRLRLKLSLDGLSTTGTTIFIGMFSLLALSHSFLLGLAAMFGCGVGWTIKNSSLNVAVQLAAPNWVRARAYSVYLVVFQGCTAAGAVIWGALASFRGMPAAFFTAAGVLGIGIVATYCHKLSHAEKLDVNESTHWEDPQLTHMVPRNDQGPVMVSVEYVIDPAQAQQFLAAVQELAMQRRRDGAYEWYIFRDLADAGRFYESFLVETWGEHVRQHERVLVCDREVEQRVDAFHIKAEKPVVRHFIAAGNKQANSAAHPVVANFIGRPR